MRVHGTIPAAIIWTCHVTRNRRFYGPGAYCRPYRGAPTSDCLALMRVWRQQGRRDACPSLAAGGDDSLQRSAHCCMPWQWSGKRVHHPTRLSFVFRVDFYFLNRAPDVVYAAAFTIIAASLGSAAPTESLKAPAGGLHGGTAVVRHVVMAAAVLGTAGRGGCGDSHGRRTPSARLLLIAAAGAIRRRPNRARALAAGMVGRRMPWTARRLCGARAPEYDRCATDGRSFVSRSGTSSPAPSGRRTNPAGPFSPSSPARR